MTRRDWWMGVLVLAGALGLHAAWPRYEWRQVNGLTFVRIDRWMGGATAVRAGWGEPGPGLLGTPWPDWAVASAIVAAVGVAGLMWYRRWWRRTR